MKIHHLFLIGIIVSSSFLLGGCAGSANHRVVSVSQERDDTLSCREIESEKRKAQVIISAVERDKEDYSGDDIIDGILWFPFNVIAKQSNYSSASNAAEARIDHLSSLEVTYGCKSAAAGRSNSDSDIAKQLKLLNESHKANLLSKDEYMEKREKILTRVDGGHDRNIRSNQTSKIALTDIRSGQHSYQVTELAKADSCMTSGLAELLSKQETLEYYKVGCEGKEPMIFKCQYQICSKQN